MRAEQEIKDELKIFERDLVDMEICKRSQETSIRETKLRIGIIKWILKGEKDE